MQQGNHKSTPSFKKDSLYFFAAKLFPALAFFISWMYYSRQLSQDAYGHYHSFWIQLITLSAVLTIGFPSFALTYTPATLALILRNIRPRRRLLYLFAILVFALLFSLAQAADNTLPYLLSVTFLILYIGVLLTEAVLAAFRSFRTLIIINTCYATGFIAAHIYTVQNGYELCTLLYWLLLLFTLRLVISLFLCNKIYHNTLHRDENILPAEELGRIRSLWIHTGIGDIIQVLFRWIDKFVLSFVLSKELFAVYVNTTIEIPFFPIVFTAVSSAALQHWAGMKALQRQTDPGHMLHYSSRILSSIVFPLFFFLVFYSREFLVTIFSEQYLEGLTVFLCAQLILPVRAYPFTTLLQHYHRGDILNKGAIADFALACLLMYPLYLLMGLPGVALSFVISTYCQAAYYLISSSRVSGIPVTRLIPAKHLAVKGITCAVLMGGAHFLAQKSGLPTPSAFWSGILLMTICSGIFLWTEWNKKDLSYEHTAQ